MTAPEEQALYDIAFRARGPILHVAPTDGGALEVLARAARDAGRGMPVIAAGTGAPADPPPGVVALSTEASRELRSLRLRFAAAVVAADGGGEALTAEIGALAPVLRDGAELAALNWPAADAVPGRVAFAGGTDALLYRERVGDLVVLERSERPQPDVPGMPGQAARRERREELYARAEARRRSRETAEAVEETLPAAHDDGLDGREGEERPGVAVELERLGRRLAEAQATCDALAGSLVETRRRMQIRTVGAQGGDPAAARSAGGRSVTVVVAVHNAHDEVVRCVESLLANTGDEHRILLIDDASTDRRIAPLLHRLAEEHEQVSALFNPENRGYTGTINIGCDWALGDVVLLNSDTVVPPGWLRGLQSVALSRPDVATVTPVSNAAGAFSVPEVNVDTPLPEDVSVAEMAALVARVSQRLRPEAPTGNGFCMYVRRRALDRIGVFDEEAFPRGYGEENDFCQRAIAAGFVNVIDDATFVYHQRSASFGPEKAALIDHAKQQLQARHPNYSPDVRRFLAEDPLGDLRAAVATAMRRGSAEIRRLPRSRPTLLFVLHAGGGGTPQTAQDLASSLRATFRCLTLKCDLDAWSVVATEPDGSQVDVARYPFATRWRTAASIGTERLEAFRRLCADERVALVHVRSLVASGPELVTAAKELGLPVVCSLHDFWPICPTIQLLDQDEVFCGGRCTPGEGTCPTSRKWVSGIPPLKHRYVYEWRAWMAGHLARSDAFVTTSRAAESVLVDNFEFMADGRMHVIEHGRDSGDFEPAGSPPGERPKVVAFGALGVSKGTTLLHRLLELDQQHGPAFEFHFLGARHPGFDPEAFGGVVHGPYGREELPVRLRDIRPSFALVASIWPETYCHTLTEAWFAGIPVFASDIGTLRERVRRHGGGWLLDYTDPEAFYLGMRAAGASVADWALKRDEIARMPPRTVDDMAADYRELYRTLLRAGVPRTPVPA